MHFKQPDLRLLEQTEEIELETIAAESSTARRSTLWVVVVGEDAFVRSVNGDQGHWYQEITRRRAGTLYTDELQIPIYADPISDEQLQQQVSEAYLRKYAQYPEDVLWMVVPTAAPTTLRLRPDRRESAAAERGA